MNKLVAWGLLAVALPAFAAQPEVLTQFNGMNIEVEPLGVAEASSEKVDLVGVPAVKVTNRSNEIASCQFQAEPEETAMTAAPAFSVNPGEQVVMRVPGKYSAGGPLALLVCAPEGVPLAD